MNITNKSNLPKVIETDEVDNEAFGKAMEMLDHIAYLKRNT